MFPPENVIGISVKGVKNEETDYKKNKVKEFT